MAKAVHSLKKTLLSQIWIPELLVWYKYDFAGDDRDGKLLHEGLLEFISSQSPGEFGSSLRNLIDKNRQYHSGKDFKSHTLWKKLIAINRINLINLTLNLQLCLIVARHILNVNSSILLLGM